MFSNGLESLLDKEDLRQTGWEGWSAESVQQVSVTISFYIHFSIGMVYTWVPPQRIM